MDNIHLDTLLRALEDEAKDAMTVLIISTVREELAQLSQSIGWAHTLVSFYADSHEKKLTDWLYSADRKQLTEKFVRNDRFRQHLEAHHPWLAFNRDNKENMKTFNSFMQVEEFTAEEMDRRWPGSKKEPVAQEPIFSPESASEGDDIF